VLETVGKISGNNKILIKTSQREIRRPNKVIHDLHVKDILKVQLKRTDVRASAEPLTKWTLIYPYRSVICHAQ